MGTARPPMNDGVIENNYVNVEMPPNREVGTDAIDSALRMRNDVDSEGPQTNLNISGNTFIAQDGPGFTMTVYTVWISYVNNAGAMNNANVNLDYNTIEGIVNTTAPTYDAYALDLDEVDAGIDMTISNNVLESNDTSLALGGYNDGNINDVTFIGNTLDISNAASGAAVHGYPGRFRYHPDCRREHSRHGARERRHREHCLGRFGHQDYPDWYRAQRAGPELERVGRCRERPSRSSAAPTTLSTRARRIARATS